LGRRDAPACDVAGWAGILEAAYDGTFGTPKTEAGLREIHLSDAAML